jgi:hypothetical protein
MDTACVFSGKLELAFFDLRATLVTLSTLASEVIVRRKHVDGSKSWQSEG